MRSSGRILKAVRKGVFGWTQASLGRRLGLAGGTICRLEGRKDGHRVTMKHLHMLRQLHPPRAQAASFDALLVELAAAIQKEDAAEEAALEEGEGQALPADPLLPADESAPIQHPVEAVAVLAERDEQLRLAERMEEAARCAVKAVRHAEQLRQTEHARYVEESLSFEAAARRAEEAAQRAEELHEADEVERAEAQRKSEEMGRRAEEAARCAEQVRLKEEARRAEDARQGAEAARQAEQAAKRAEHHLLEEDARRAEDTRQREEAARRVEQAAKRAEHLLVESEALRAEDARAREEGAQRAEQLGREEEARRAEEVRAREEAARRVAQAAERVEQLFREAEARRAEEARDLEECTRRAEDAAERAEKLCAEQDARRAAEAQTQENAAKRRASEWRQVRRLAVATVAASAVLGVLGGAARKGFEAAVPRAGSGETAQAGNQATGRREAPPVSPMISPDFVDAGPPDSGELLTSGLDGGTEFAKLATQALPFAKGALPQQLGAPCPASAEEINGLCWARWPLTPAQVKDGFCDSIGLYEPSPGWCRAHHAGYRPVRGVRRNSNTVEPE